MSIGEDKELAKKVYSVIGGAKTVLPPPPPPPAPPQDQGGGRPRPRVATQAAVSVPSPTPTVASVPLPPTKPSTPPLPQFKTTQGQINNVSTGAAVMSNPFGQPFKQSAASGLPKSASASAKKKKPANPNMPQTPSGAPGAGKPSSTPNVPVYLPPTPPYPFQYQPETPLIPATDYKGNVVLDANGNPIMMPQVPTSQPGQPQQVVLPSGAIINVTGQPAMPGGYVDTQAGTYTYQTENGPVTINWTPQSALQSAITEATFLANSLPPQFQPQTFNLGGGVTGWVPPATLQGPAQPVYTGGGGDQQQEGGGGGGGGKGGGGPKLPADTPAPVVDIVQLITDLPRVKGDRVVDMPQSIQQILKGMGQNAQLWMDFMRMLGYEFIGQIGEFGFPSDLIIPGQVNFSPEALALLKGLDAGTLANFTNILRNMLGVEIPAAPPPAPAPVPIDIQKGAQTQPVTPGQVGVLPPGQGPEIPEQPVPPPIQLPVAPTA